MGAHCTPDLNGSFNSRNSTPRWQNRFRSPSTLWLSFINQLQWVLRALARVPETSSSLSGWKLKRIPAARASMCISWASKNALDHLPNESGVRSDKFVKMLDDETEMLIHGGFCTVRISRADGVQNCFVLLQQSWDMVWPQR